MRDLLRSVLVGACGLPAVLLAVAATAAPAMASEAGPQRSATPNVTAEIGYARATVHPGDQDTMTVSLINHGPQSLDDHTSVHITVTMPQDAAVSSNVVETIPGNAPTGSSNAVPSTRSVPVTQVFVRSAPGFFDVVVPAGSFGNSTSFRTYTFTLRISPTAPQGTELIGGGVAVALENYVGLTVEKSVVPPPPVVVVPKTPSTPHKSGGSGGKSGGPKTPVKPVTPVSQRTAGSSEWTQRWTGTLTWTGCSGDMSASGSGSGGSGQCECPGYQNMHGNGGGNSSTGGSGSAGGSAGGSGGVGTCPCPVDAHMSAPSGGSGNGSGGSGTCGCPVDSHMSAPSGGSGSSGGTGGPVKCGCPVDQHMSAPSGGSGVQCTAAGLAATGGEPTWPLAIGVFALAGGAALMRVARGRNWSRP